MLKKLTLSHFKGFSRFDIQFGKQSVLVGPNNAGKSTIISALRLAAEQVNHARKRNSADRFILDGSAWARGHILSSTIGNPSGFIGENIRHEFREAESRMTLSFDSGATLQSVWPVDDLPFFCLQNKDSSFVTTALAARSVSPVIGVVPTLTPVQHREAVLTERHVRDNQSTRLASSHFRNQLYHLRNSDRSSYDDLVEFILDNTPEIQALSLTASPGDKSTELDLFFTESATRSEKEVFWAGDGLQIWLQVLTQLFKHRAAKTIVLDEPDVFLHPDLQRRLINVLEDQPQQWIMATHAPEVLAESRRDSVIWVDRTRTRAKSLRDSKSFDQASQQLGSGFNLGVARALRSKVALFVEGQDMKALRIVARKVGAAKLSGEKGVAVIPLGGFDNWTHVGAFSWLNDNLLDKAVSTYVILDRDNRTDQQVFDVHNELSSAGIRGHVWKRKELESYFLIPAVISRISGADLTSVEQMLADVVAEQKVDTQAQYVHRRQTTMVSATVHLMDVYRTVLPEFESIWADPSQRIAMCPPKKVLASLNRKLSASGHKNVSVRAIASTMRADEVVPEVRDLLLEIESTIAGS
ncbi:ATP-dependent nuclease [Streptomyces erythrochromogenes]|uniref:ATP-dependent nuclease n=1 Tax=Streptomyces erythrochromogenes TaxID=285574 RepID=UPI003449111A